MRYLSVCSGIEAATMAWHKLGWTPLAFSEIEPFPCAVLAHHYPNVPNLGDMTKYKEWPNYEGIDVLVGGTPCQSFSVAGLRKGLDDPRGNLMLTYLAIAEKYKPRYVVWENVPGVLSSNKGRDFGTFLGALAELGYGFAYRVLDAQYCRTREFPGAVPQRRRRVFVIGYFGDWRRAAAVLFDGASLRGDPAPSREAGQKITGTTKGCSGECGSETSDGNHGGLAASGFETGPTGGRFTNVAPTMDCRAKDGPIRNQLGVGVMVSPGKGYTLSGHGEYKEGQGILRASGGDCGGGSEVLIPTVSGTLSAGAHYHSDTPYQGHMVPVCFDDRRGRCGDLASRENLANTLHSAKVMSGQQCVAFSCKDSGNDSGIVAPTCARCDCSVAVRDGEEWEQGIDVCDHCAQEQAHTSNTDKTTDVYCMESSASHAAIGKNVSTTPTSKPLGVASPIVIGDHGASKPLSPVAFNGDVARTLNARHDSSPCADRGMDVVAVPVYGFGGESDASSLSGAGNIQPPITCRHGAPGFVAHPVVPLAYDMTHGDDPMRPCGERSPTLQGRMGTGGNQVPVIQSSYAVRRLTVTECERLQGFPDHFTQVPYRNKPACDGPRYKALGNSMAVNCMRWLGLRIQKIDEVGDV